MIKIYILINLQDLNLASFEPLHIYNDCYRCTLCEINTAENFHCIQSIFCEYATGILSICMNRFGAEFFFHKFIAF